MNKEGKFEKFRSNYIDERNEPLYAFGYGLSYTNFSYTNLKISKDKFAKYETITVSVDVSIPEILTKKRWCKCTSEI